MPEKHRTPLLLLVNEEMSYDEIATVLMTSLSTVKMRIHHGRKALKRRLKPYLLTGAWFNANSRRRLGSASSKTTVKQGQKLLT